MKLTSYTVKKSLLTKTTLKSATGSYSSDENGAEVVMTFVDSPEIQMHGGKEEEIEVPIDTDKANRMANEEVRKLLNWSQPGSDWLNKVTTEGGES